MFSKQLFTTLSLLVLAASSALAAPPLQCPAVSTVTVAATDVAVSSSAVVSSAAATATSIASGDNNGGKEGNGRDGHNGKGNHGKDKGGKGRGGNNNNASSSAASATDSISSATGSISSATDSVSSETDSISATDSITASSTEVASSELTSAASATSTLAIGGGDKGVGGSGLASSALASATSDVASSSATAAPPAAASGSATTDDQQAALTLNPAVIATGFASDGQQVPTEGQVPSLTSTNNFINFCLTVDKPITNGQQIKTGSCNPAPIGVIAATTNMPSSKFVFPKNNVTIDANQAFTIQMAINNIQTGNFVNAQSNYYSAPQQVNAQGDIIGHTHVVIELLDSLDQTTPTDPQKFAFFKGINGAAVNGVVSADVANGLPAGAYRIASINAAANHQPVLVAVAQHGSLDDMVYFTVQ